MIFNSLQELLEHIRKTKENILHIDGTKDLGFKLSNSDLSKIVEALNNNPQITTLAFNSCAIDDTGAQIIAGATNLIILDLNDNNIGDAGTTALAANSGLAVLCLKSNAIKDAGAEALAANTTLIGVNLKCNMIEDAGAAAIVKNTTLVAISFRSTVLDPGIELELLAKNRNKKAFDKICQKIIDNQQLSIEEIKFFEQKFQAVVNYLCCDLPGIGFKDEIHTKFKLPNGTIDREALSKILKSEYFESGDKLAQAHGIEASSVDGEDGGHGTTLLPDAKVKVPGDSEPAAEA